MAHAKKPVDSGERTRVESAAMAVKKLARKKASSIGAALVAFRWRRTTRAQRRAIASELGKASGRARRERAEAASK